MKNQFYILTAVLILCSCTDRSVNEGKEHTGTIPLIDRSLALKPPMGWNSWDCLGWGATEAEVKEAALYMEKNLKSLGYEYIVVDMLWYGDEKAVDFEAFVHETIPSEPVYNIDRYGRLWPDTIRFPSSAGNKGFKPLADYIHSLGLKFGLHILRGMPWQAAEMDLPVKGTGFRAGSFALPGKGCVWYDGFYGINMAIPGAQEYYNSQFELFAEWGVDFIKADDIVNSEELKGISKAARSCGRNIVLSVVPDNIPWEVLKENAHMARTGADFWDVWQMVKTGFPVAASVVKEAEPGFWPDLDMLPVGKLGLKISYKGPDPRISRFTSDELHSLLTLWYIARMPLMIGGYLPETDSLTLELLSNREALDVNRNCINPRQIKFKNAIITWAADIPVSNGKYVAFFNQWESRKPVDIGVAFSELGLDTTREYTVRDLWEKKDLGRFKNMFSCPVNAHGAGLFMISDSATTLNQ